MIHVKRGLLFTNQVRFSINVEVLSDTKILTVDDHIIQWLDPDGTSRNVDLPAEESSTNLMLMILNVGSTATKTLVIRNDAATTIATLLPGMTGVFSCDGTNWKWEHEVGFFYDKILGRICFGHEVPLYNVADNSQYKVFFQNRSIIIEDDEAGSPQIKFKTDNTSNVATITFQDKGDDNQWLISIRSSDHATEARQFKITQQYNGGTWYDPFTIKSQVPNNAFVLDTNGLNLYSESIYGCTLELKSDCLQDAGTLKFKDSGDGQSWYFTARASDHGTEARQFKITEYNQGSTWYDPFTIKPTTPNHTLVLEPTKVNIGLPLVRSQTPQTLTGAGAVDVTSSITHIVTTAANDLTLIDGSEGQEKFIVMKTDEGAGTLTPTNLGNGSTITFDDVGDSAHLLFTNGFWYFVGGTATLGA